MTPPEIASLLGARKVGLERWTAKCPAHQDRSPSLSIATGRDSRVLLRCWAGCDLEAVLKAAGLRMTDLFDGPPPTPEQARGAAKMRESLETAARERRAAHGSACDRIHKLERIAGAFAAKLVHLPDGAEANAMETLFNAALDKVRAAEDREMELRP